MQISVGTFHELFIAQLSYMSSISMYSLSVDFFSHSDNWLTKVYPHDYIDLNCILA